VVALKTNFQQKIQDLLVFRQPLFGRQSKRIHNQ
jgi:hypothetical protein